MVDYNITEENVTTVPIMCNYISCSKVVRAMRNYRFGHMHSIADSGLCHVIGKSP